ncbi:hypothetical protein [Paraburkholderia sp. BCC1885]|uniref:hypothetical protein n=1 Tax=Paraburkholderia sp. BCC1885 TaxID=2562669 RepID=UPI0011829964|nr:hypothetical protein [Paraburkholderia sp. BCC1885]
MANSHRENHRDHAAQHVLRHPGRPDCDAERRWLGEPRPHVVVVVITRAHRARYGHSITDRDLQRHPELSINFPDAPLWREVEKLSGLTGASGVPEHKAAQFRFEADKWSVAGFTRIASAHTRPGRIAGCPLRMEAIVESLSPVEDEPEGFTVIIARVNATHAIGRMNRPVRSS